MTDYFYKHRIRIFDYPRWAEPLRETPRSKIERRGDGQTPHRVSGTDNAFGWIADFEHLKYYLTGLGKQVIAVGLKLKKVYIIPELSATRPLKISPNPKGTQDNDNKILNDSKPVPV
jgi:hypothetical protein